MVRGRAFVKVAEANPGATEAALGENLCGWTETRFIHIVKNNEIW